MLRNEIRLLEVGLILKNCNHAKLKKYNYVKVFNQLSRSFSCLIKMLITLKTPLLIIQTLF